MKLIKHGGYSPGYYVWTDYMPVCHGGRIRRVELTVYLGDENVFVRLDKGIPAVKIPVSSITKTKRELLIRIERDSYKKELMKMEKSKVKVEISCTVGQHYWVNITLLNMSNVVLKCSTECYSYGAAKRKARKIIKALNLEEVK